jgi:putative component of membrane protein insertase Oxa1/YidC/SpoIIIJ protein YidD
MSPPRAMVLSTLLFLLCRTSSASPAPEWEPAAWPPPPGALGLQVQTGPLAEPPREGLVEAAYHWYRTRVSPNDGARCPFYPTCSGYAVTAVRKRGMAVGALLAIDRLLREYPWMDDFDHYPIVMPHDTPRLSDPVPPRPRKRR